MTHHINEATVDVVKEFEGLRLDAYRCAAGVVTIGYGYTNRAGFGPGVKMGDRWTQKQAEDMLTLGLEVFAEEIAPHIKARTNDNEFGAMLSLAYNIGTGNFAKSTMLKRFNAGDKAGAAKAMMWWNKADGRVLNGLVRRREAERAMFLSEDWQDARTTPDEPRNTPAKSTTIQAVSVAGLAQLTALVDPVTDVIERLGVSPEFAVTALTLIALVWIFRERIRKWTEGDR